jgi:hypothetical protein
LDGLQPNHTNHVRGDTMNHIRTTVIAGLASIAALAVPAAAQADDTTAECRTVDYQGAPLEMCPAQEPDPTNCYTGDYQGAPIEICMPTGWVPDPSWTTHQGEPIVMHVSKDYVAPVTTVDAPAPVAVPASSPAPAPVVEAPLDVVSIAAAAVAGIPLVVG